jgi:hypothetical protein
MASSTPAAPAVPAVPAAPAIPDEKLMLSLQNYCFNERMVRTFQRELGFGNYDIDLIRYILSRILLMKWLVKNC